MCCAWFPQWKAIIPVNGITWPFVQCIRTVFSLRQELQVEISLDFNQTSIRTLEFHFRPVLVRFVMDKMALTSVSISLLRFFLVSKIQILHRIVLNLHVALTARTNWRNLGTLKKCFFGNRKAVARINYCFLQVLSPCHVWRRLSVLLSTRRPGLDHRSVHVGFMFEIMSVAYVLLYSPVSII